MYCDKCGKELPEGIQRCMDCYPRDPQEKKRLLRRIMIAAGALVVAAGIALAASIYFAPAAVVQRALHKSVSALNDRNLLPAVSASADKTDTKSRSNSVYLQLERISGLDAETAALMKGLGLRLDVGADLPARRLHSVLSLNYGAAELVSFGMYAEDTNLMVGSPLLLGDILLGVDTKTLGQELRRLGVEDEALTGLSFDYFELLSLLEDYSKSAAAAQEKAVRQMVSAIEVEKVGKTVYAIGGESYACTEYTATLPRDALEEFLLVLEAPNGLAEETVTKLLTSVGLPEEEIAVDSDADTEELARVLDAVGDVELHLFLSGGRILGVTWGKTIEGVRVNLSLSLAGKTYGEDVTLRLSAKNGDEEAAMELNFLSQEKDGEASGTVTLTVEAPEQSADMVLDWAYAPKAEEENLTLGLTVDGREYLSAIGQLDVTETDSSLLFDEICLYDETGEELLCLSGGFGEGPYTAPEREDNVWMLSEMSAEELQALPEQISLFATLRLSTLVYDYPQLAALLSAFSA